MKIYLRSAEELTGSDILFEDKILIDIDISDIYDVIEPAEHIKFPGNDAFRSGISKILKDEYKFDITPESEGELEYVTNRDLSESVYFNTYYELYNAGLPLERLGINSLKPPAAGKVHCFIHFRISGHILENVGDIAHIQFLDRNVEEHVKNRPDINFIQREEEIILPEYDLYFNYEKAVDELRSDLDVRIFGWVNKAKKQYPELFDLKQE